MPEGHRRLDGALEGRTSLSNAQMKGIIAFGGELFIGTDHDNRVVVFHRYFEIPESVLLKEASLPQRRLHHGLGGRGSVFVKQTFVERPSIHADSDARTVLGGSLTNRFDLVVELADISGVDAHRATASLDRLEDVLRLEVDIGNHRDLGPFGDDR